MVLKTWKCQLIYRNNSKITPEQGSLNNFLMINSQEQIENRTPGQHAVLAQHKIILILPHRESKRDQLQPKLPQHQWLLCDTVDVAAAVTVDTTDETVVMFTLSLIFNGGAGVLCVAATDSDANTVDWVVVIVPLIIPTPMLNIWVTKSMK